MSWSSVTFGDLIASGVLEVGDGYRAKNGELGGEYLPFLRQGLIGDDGVMDFSSAALFKEGPSSKAEAKSSNPHDVLVVTKGWSTGRVAFMLPEHPRVVYSPHVSYWRCHDLDVLDPHYLRQWSRCPEFTKQLEALAGTCTLHPYLSLRNQGLLRITVPPLPEQRRIAAILGALDDKIELNRRMNRTLEEMAQALFKSWFIDFDGHDPATLVDSELGPIPEGWELRPVEQMAEELETGSRPKGGIGGITEGVPSIGAESIKGVGEFNFSKTKFVSPEFFDKLRRGVLKSRDLLLYKDGGKPGDFRPHVGMFGDGFPFERCAINSHVYRLRLGQPLSQEYGYFWFSSDLVMAEMRRLGTGVAIPSLPKRNLLAMKLLVPDADSVVRFDQIASPTVGRILANANESRTLAELRDTLLPKLISGELRVPESLDELLDLHTDAASPG